MAATVTCEDLVAMSGREDADPHVKVGIEASARSRSPLEEIVEQRPVALQRLSSMTTALFRRSCRVPPPAAGGRPTNLAEDSSGSAAVLLAPYLDSSRA